MTKLTTQQLTMWVGGVWWQSHSLGVWGLSSKLLQQVIKLLYVECGPLALSNKDKWVPFSTTSLPFNVDSNKIRVSQGTSPVRYAAKCWKPNLQNQDRANIIARGAMAKDSRAMMKRLIGRKVISLCESGKQFTASRPIK